MRTLFPSRFEPPVGIPKEAPAPGMGMVGTFLKSLGIDPAEAVALGNNILAELRAHNEKLEALTAAIARVEAKSDRAALVENVLRLTVPDANAILTEGDITVAIAGMKASGIEPQQGLIGAPPERVYPTLGAAMAAAGDAD